MTVAYSDYANKYSIYYFMKKIALLISFALALFFLSCAPTDEFTEFVPIENLEEEKIYYFDNAFNSFDYQGKKIDDIYSDKFIKEEDHIPFEGMFIGAPVKGKMHFNKDTDEPVIEYVTFAVYEDDLSQYDCQEYLYNTYGALIAEGAEDDAGGQIYWRRYFTGQKILKYSKKAKENFYTITVE